MCGVVVLHHCLQWARQAAPLQLDIQQVCEKKRLLCGQIVKILGAGKRCPAMERIRDSRQARLTPPSMFNHAVVKTSGASALYPIPIHLFYHTQDYYVHA